MLGRFEIQANDVGRFVFKGRVIGQHIAPHSVRPELSTGLHPRYHHVANSQMLGQLTRAPMCRSIRSGVACRVKYLGLHGRCTDMDLPASMARIQTCDAIGHKSPLPSKHIMFVTAQPFHNRSTGVAFCQHENKPSTADVFGSQTARLNTLTKFESFRWSQPNDGVV